MPTSCGCGIVGFQSPCGDLLIGNYFFSLFSFFCFYLFQSPCGDLLIGNHGTKRLTPITAMFQSPCGDLLIGNSPTINRGFYQEAVSVPLRGFINRKHLLRARLSHRIEFQSPCGDLLIGNQRTGRITLLVTSFSPLAGIY